MKVVERYILQRALVLFLGALAWTLAIVWTTQVLARIDLVTDSGQSALTFFKVATLIIPSVVPIVVPFSVVVAVAQTLSVMNTDSELVVINAAGASRLMVARPILLLALCASVLCFVVHNGVDPYARQKNRELVASARADLLSLVIQEGTFRKVEDGLFLQVGERLPDNQLGGIFVADSREEGVDLVYYAKRGAIVDRKDEKVLLMSDGVVHRKTPSGEVSVIHFTSYAFDLSAFSADAERQTLLPKDQTTAYLLNPDPNDPVFQHEPGLYRTELFKRFSDWLFPVTFALIALAVAGDARSHREARLHPLVTSISIALITFWLTFFFEGKAKTNPAFNYAMAAMPVAMSLICAWFIYRQKAMELPVGWTDALMEFGRGAGQRLAALRASLGRTRGGTA
ncbi:MAG: LPS export ABC transporter permease LptF [Mesorhizobium sp.]